MVSCQNVNILMKGAVIQKQIVDESEHSVVISWLRLL